MGLKPKGMLTFSHRQLKQTAKDIALKIILA
jgi:hypothetical protein